ncbi:MAG: hypothetical protein AAGA71_12155 [Pseudomonadota bacterium]
MSDRDNHGDDQVDLCLALRDLEEPYLRFVRSIAEEAKTPEGSQSIALLMAVKHDHRLSSLVEIAMTVPSDDLDQLLFAAEDFYRQFKLSCG